MKKNDYRNHLDGIKCSAEFRTKMEQKLSSAPNGEYADSVSNVEYAPKVNYHRWTALAASVLIIVGIGGFAFLSRGSAETQIGSSVSSEGTTVPENEYSINVSVSYKDKMTSLGALPPELAERYIREMKSWDDFKIDYIPHLKSEPTGSITLSFTGEDSFTWKIDSNGYAVTKRNGETTEAYYSNICYLSLNCWIARDMPYLDWSCIIEGDKGTAIDTAFRNHADEIEITDSLGDMSSSVAFFECGIFSGVINQSGDILISNSQESTYFRSSSALYQEIYNAVQDDLISRITESENMFYASSGGTAPYYNVNFGKCNFSNLCDAIKSVRWIVATDEMPRGEFFNIDNYIYVAKNCIYDDKNHVSFIAEDSKAYAEIFDTAEHTMPQGFHYIAYLIASADSRFDTISGEITYINNEYISGTGEFFYGNKNNDEYIYISDENVSAELNMSNYHWTLETTKEGNTTSEEGYSNELPELEYTSIKKDLLYYMNRAAIGENTTNMADKTVVNDSTIKAAADRYDLFLDIEYHWYHVTISVGIDRTGNILDLDICEENQQNIPDNVPRTIKFHLDNVVYDK